MGGQIMVRQSVEQYFQQTTNFARINIHDSDTMLKSDL